MVEYFIFYAFGFIVWVCVSVLLHSSNISGIDSRNLLLCWEEKVEKVINNLHKSSVGNGIRMIGISGRGDQCDQQKNCQVSLKVPQ